MKRLWIKFQNKFLTLSILLFCQMALAVPIRPPSGNIITDGKSAITVGGGIIYEVLALVCCVVGIGLFVGCASTVAAALKTAQEKQDIGHFFKYLFVSLLCAALGAGLLYSAYLMIPSKGN